MDDPPDVDEPGVPVGLVHAPALDARVAAREALAGTARAHPDEPFALHGCVLTPEEMVGDGYVVIDGSQIRSVTRRRPSATKIIDTAGVILPGLIDLHGHSEYNVFAAWEPPKNY